MTQPRTPGEALSDAAARITAQREATRNLARELADKRTALLESTAPPRPEVTP